MAPPSPGRDVLVWLSVSLYFKPRVNHVRPLEPSEPCQPHFLGIASEVHFCHRLRASSAGIASEFYLIYGRNHERSQYVWPNGVLDLRWKIYERIGEHL